MAIKISRNKETCAGRNEIGVRNGGFWIDNRL